MSLSPPPVRDKLPISKDMAGNTTAEMSRAWIKWFTDVKDALSKVTSGVATAWASISKVGSNLTDIETRNHDDLQNLNTVTHTHLTFANASDLTDGGITALHKHDFDHITFPAQWTIGNLGHIYTLQELMNHEWSAGIVDGAILTDNGNGTIGLSSSIGVVRAVNDGHAQLYGFSAAAQTPIALTDNATNYIYISYNAGSPTFIATTNFADMDGTTKILTYVVHRNGTVLHYLDVRDQNVDTINKVTTLFSKFSNFIHAQGGTALGSSGLSVTVTAGSFFYQLQEKPHVAFNTSIAGTANANVFALWYRNGVGGWTEVPNSKVIDTTVYDNNTGTPVALTNNKFGVTWFYIVNDSPSELHAVMGEAIYADLASAAAASPPGTLPSIISGLGSLIGFVAYQKGNTVFDNVYSAFTVNFVATQPTVHNGLSGLQGGTINEYYHLTNAEHSINGIVKGSGTAFSAAISGTDYSAGTSALSTGILKSTTTTGALSIAAAASDYVAPSAYASANGLTMSTARLLGRTTAGTGAAEEISIGTNLTLSAGILSATGGSSVIDESDYLISQNYTITTGKNGLSVYPTAVASGFTVTVPAGAVWTIIT